MSHVKAGHVQAGRARADRSSEGRSGENQRRGRSAPDIAIVLTGYVRPNDVPSFCRDGADYWVETVGWHRHVRVCAAGPEAARLLAEASGGSKARVVCGQLKRGPVPGCDLLEVHAVHPVAEFFPSSVVAA